MLLSAGKMQISVLQKCLKPQIFLKIPSRRVESQHSKEVLDCFTDERFPIPNRYREHMVDKTFWDEFKAYAQKNQATNLGEEQAWCKGCQNTRKFLQDIGNTKKTELLQYTRAAGHIRLVNAVADFYERYLWENRTNICCIDKIDPMNEILITNGVQEAIYVAIMSLIGKGDEVVIIEPYRNSYVQVVSEAGGKIRYIPLKPEGDPTNCDNWTFDEVWLGQIINSKTKMVIVNNPQFPLGKIWKRCEMEKLLYYLQKWNIMVLCDESQDFLAVDPVKHRHFCTEAGFWERTMTIWSISDLFGLPGWNVACLYGPNYFMEQAAMVHKDMIYLLPTQIQEALALALEREISNQCTTCAFSASLLRGLEPRRQILFDALNDGRFQTTWPQSGYWMVAKYKPGVSEKADHYHYKDCFEDFKINKWLSDNLKFQGIPMTPFYSKEHSHFAEEYLAFCYHNDIKKIAGLRKIIKRFNEIQLC